MTDHDWSLTTDPKTGEVVTITPLQYEAIWRAMRIWHEVCAEADNEYVRDPDYCTHWVNIMKSRLLGRMLFNGKPPHPTAPPNEHAGGWWELVEDGIAYLPDRMYWGPNDTKGEEGIVMGICGEKWQYLRTEENGDIIVAHHRMPGEEWRLSRCTEQSERTITGYSIRFEKDEAGVSHAVGDKIPVYTSTILERISSGQHAQS